MTLDQYNQLQKGTTSFTMLVRITATPERGGDVMRLALNSRPITFGGEVYDAVPFEVSEFQATAGTEVDNRTFQTALRNTLNRINLRGGKWQGGRIETFVVDFLNLQLGAIQTQNGRFGQVKILGRETEIEYRGLMQLLSQEIGEKTSRLCRYQLGDANCKKDLGAFTFTGTVTAVNSKQKFTISVSKADNYFYRGRITFTSGLNLGLSMETTANTGTLLTLFQPMLDTVAVGDAFSIVAGDSKTIEVCHNKFSNAINFGGEPSMPEREQLFRFPDN